MDSDLKYCYMEMLDELERHSLQVELAPAPEKRHSGHKVRIAVGNNPSWYSWLCSKNMVQPRRRNRKAYTRIVRGYIKNLLERLSQGETVDSKYCYDLEEIAREKLEEINKGISAAMSA